MTTNVGAQVRELTQVKETVATSVAVVTSRLTFMDNLRVFLTILVPLVHMAITYGGAGSWFYAERPTTELAGILLTLFVALCQFFFMGLFFMISGYFIPGSIDRKGSWKYIKDRLVRLGIPLVLFSLLISPFDEYSKSVTVYQDYSGSFINYVLNYWKNRTFAPGPLWFVEILLVFSLAYALGRAILSLRKSMDDKTSSPAVKKPLTNAWIVAFILACAPLNYIVRIFSPIGNEWQHVQLAFMPQYILMFMAGILAYRRGWLPDLPNKMRKTWSVIAIVMLLSLPVLMVVSGATEDTGPVSGGLTWQSALLSIWEPMFCVAMAILLLNVFRRRFDIQGVLGRIMSKNAYTVYIIHPLIIIPAAYLARNIALDPMLKWVLVSPIAIVICFMVSQLLVRRIPLSEKIL
jgi:fucose 4-O-acetylase-like acetyltransferase